MGTSWGGNLASHCQKVNGEGFPLEIVPRYLASQRSKAMIKVALAPKSLAFDKARGGPAGACQQVAHRFYKYTAGWRASKTPPPKRWNVLSSTISSFTARQNLHLLQERPWSSPFFNSSLQPLINRTPTVPPLVHHCLFHSSIDAHLLKENSTS